MVENNRAFVTLKGVFPFELVEPITPKYDIMEVESIPDWSCQPTGCVTQGGASPFGVHRYITSVHFGLAPGWAFAVTSDAVAEECPMLLKHDNTYSYIGSIFNDMQSIQNYSTDTIVSGLLCLLAKLSRQAIFPKPREY